MDRRSTSVQRNPDVLTSSLGIVANGDVTHVVPVTAAGYYNGHSAEEMVASIEKGATLAKTQIMKGRR